MRIIQASLSEFSERPLLIVGVTRPSMSRDVRAVWQATGAHELTLRPLGDRAAERYARAVTPGVHDAKQSIELAAGTPRLLHALVAAGNQPGTPSFETALGLFAERLTQLPVSERNVLCGASIFADRVWSSGVAALFDGNPFVQRDLAALCERKLLVRLPVSSSTADIEYTFAHPIVHETAYRCLRQSDRVTVRQHARRWLAHMGLDPAVLRSDDTS
jgi:hypothetical protein